MGTLTLERRWLRNTVLWFPSSLQVQTWTLSRHMVQVQELSAIAVLTENFGVNAFGNCPLWEYLHKKEAKCWFGWYQKVAHHTQYIEVCFNICFLCCSYKSINGRLLAFYSVDNLEWWKYRREKEGFFNQCLLQFGMPILQV